MAPHAGCSAATGNRVSGRSQAGRFAVIINDTITIAISLVAGVGARSPSSPDRDTVATSHGSIAQRRRAWRAKNSRALARLHIAYHLSDPTDTSVIAKSLGRRAARRPWAAEPRRGASPFAPYNDAHCQPWPRCTLEGAVRDPDTAAPPCVTITHTSTYTSWTT